MKDLPRVGSDLLAEICKAAGDEGEIRRGGITTMPPEVSLQPDAVEGGSRVYHIYWRATGLYLGSIRRVFCEHSNCWVCEERYPWQDDDEAWGSAYKGTRGETVREVMRVFSYNNGNGIDDEAES